MKNEDENCYYYEAYGSELQEKNLKGGLLNNYRHI